MGLNNKDAKLYLTNQEIIVHDYFWFTGSLTYVEVICLGTYWRIGKFNLLRKPFKQPTGTGCG